MSEGRKVYLAPRDAGRILGLTTSGVIALARRGQLREIRDSSGRRLFDPIDVAAVADQRGLAAGKKRRSRRVTLDGNVA